MSRTIYMVKSSSGVYEDYREWNEKAFTNKEDAEKYAKELDDLHQAKPQFVTDEFIEAYDQCYDDAPDWGEGPKYIEDPEAYHRWVEEKNRQNDEHIIKTMYKKGFYVTESMLQQYEEWESNRYNDWHECDVEELELCDE